MQSHQDDRILREVYSSVGLVLLHTFKKMTILDGSASYMESLNALISPEREYLEKVFVDYLRREYPTLNEFRQFAAKSFETNEYVVEDRTLKWPRDVRLCLVSFLKLPAISALARTSKAWYAVIDDKNYNMYWRNRYWREYFNCPPTARLPETITEIEVVNKKKRIKRQVDVLWFDAYQYIAYMRTRKTGKFPLGRQAFRTFLETKKRISIKVTGFPCIDNMRHWKLGCYSVPMSFFPKWIVEYFPDKPNTEKWLSTDAVADAICFYCAKHATEVFCAHLAPMLTQSANRRGKITWIVRMPHVVGQNHHATDVSEFFRPGHIRDICSQTRRRAWNGVLGSNELRNTIVSALCPDIKQVLQARWMLQGIRPE